QVHFYDAKIPFPIRYCAAVGIFTMAKFVVQADDKQEILKISTTDSPWALSYDVLPLRVLAIEPDSNPKYGMPKTLGMRYNDQQKEFKLANEKSLLQGFQQVLQEYDPDVIFARYGDAWMFPMLIEIAKKCQIDFNPSRDPVQKMYTIGEMIFESYGSIYHRASQTHLFGRWHIDPKNSTMDMGFNFSMRSAVEMARVTSVSVQTAARNSPGSGFTAMQIREALDRGTLVPLQKRQTERFKSAAALNTADRGGLNYRPIVGLHKNVAEIDFFSMYPSSMALWNISGETVGVKGSHTKYVPGTNVPITQDTPGLVASVLRPLLMKRWQVKQTLRRLDKKDPQHAVLQSIADALKWLGYVSFGYQGYKNNLFGNIQAHEAICAIGRDSLIRAKEAAYDFGFAVLGANTDSLFVKKAGSTKPKDFDPLIK
ncbi:MAG: hypothetical protein N2D54_00470, partial [Chloroflexota bacterium]